MTSLRIHRLVALCLAIVAFVVFVALWIAGGEDRNADNLIWTIFSLVGAGIAMANFAGDFRSPPLRTDWATWALPLSYVLAGILSAVV